MPVSLHREVDCVGRTGGHPQGDLAALGEFQCIGDEVAQDLTHTLAIGMQLPGRPRLNAEGECEMFLVRNRLELLVQVIEQIAEIDRLGAQLDLASLDLRQVENIVDDGQQIVAGGGDGLGETHLLGREITRAVVSENLG